MLDIVRAIHRMHGKDGDTTETDAAQKRVDELFTKLDTDKDGKLSREEFCKGFKNDAWIIKALLMKSPLVASSTTSTRHPQATVSRGGHRRTRPVWAAWTALALTN
ncbi:hypothetical protein AVEN_39225-1 [Araneus ventricosus]|uniref:EF-hand domain-containing protein n=1 Tax=Araneus ventricosus TaxID=182803 RepID=A0A4Y2TFW1_ARAVE|nr:hypothetical protein AVEN_39225-1 [Araneus ventricosus]